MGAYLVTGHSSFSLRGLQKPLWNQSWLDRSYPCFETNQICYNGALFVIKSDVFLFPITIILSTTTYRCVPILVNGMCVRFTARVPTLRNDHKTAERACFATWKPILETNDRKRCTRAGNQSLNREIIYRVL